MLDPKSDLFFYQKKTESFRNLSKEETYKYFLSLLEPHRPVYSQAISVGIWKQKLESEGSHAVWTFCALFNGTSMKSIMDSADWSKESTFSNFYLRDVDVSVLKKM